MQRFNLPLRILKKQKILKKKLQRFQFDEWAAVIRHTFPPLQPLADQASRFPLRSISWRLPPLGVLFSSRCETTQQSSQRTISVGRTGSVCRRRMLSRLPSHTAVYFDPLERYTRRGDGIPDKIHAPTVPGVTGVACRVVGDSSRGERAENLVGAFREPAAGRGGN